MCGTYSPKTHSIFDMKTAYIIFQSQCYGGLNSFFLNILQCKFVIFCTFLNFNDIRQSI